MAHTPESEFWRHVRATDRKRGLARAAAPKKRAKPRKVSRRGRGVTRAEQFVFSLMLIGVLAATHWLGLWPRLVDAISGAPSRYDVSGEMRAVDGDTLRMGRVRIRLNGIDAPEHDAVCRVKSSGKAMACGARSGDELAKLIDGRTVRCSGEGFDRYGRTRAACWVRIGGEDVDVGRRMVRQGWAIAYRRYSNRYALDETRARVEGLGIWATEFQTPEDDRHDGVAQLEPGAGP